jgi:ATP-dependent Clp protease ATP-binding subunit ClpA
MPIDPQHWSSKVQAAWQAAKELAADHQHPEMGVIHIAISLFEDPEGLAKQVRYMHDLYRNTE